MSLNDEAYTDASSVTQSDPKKVAGDVKLADAHWEYVKSVLEAHSEDENVIEKIGFHYKTAFVHGHKHGLQR